MSEIAVSEIRKYLKGEKERLERDLEMSAARDPYGYDVQAGYQGGISALEDLAFHFGIDISVE